MKKPKKPRPPIACAICGRVFSPAGRGCRKYCSLECAAEAEKRQQKSRDRRARNRVLCGVRKRDGSIVPLARRPKTYAEIQAANRANPLKAGWRGQPRAGGRPTSIFFKPLTN